MRAPIIALVGLLAVLSIGPAKAADIIIPPPVFVTPLPPGVPVREVSLARLVVDLSPDYQWGLIHWTAQIKARLTAGHRELSPKTSAYWKVFYDVVTKAGFKVDDDPRNLFESDTSSSEFAVGGSITSMDADFFIPGFGSGKKFKGKGVMGIEWQIYSRLEKRVVARLSTRGGVMIEEPAEDNIPKVLSGAFAENVKALVVSPEFRGIFIDSGPPSIGSSAATAPAPRATSANGPTVIALHGPPAEESRLITEAVKSVVIVFAGDGHGSGFLVSSDGLVLTDQHVVGTARYVKIRWSDGAEGLGEVIRSDRVRDVALIKADAGGRRPLRVRTEAIQPGETVFAIGAPLDEKFQGTVTRGIVSARRTIDGLSYLQSDVTVNPGNSGGPLLDEQGAAVAMTESGIRPGGVPSGLNLFTPVADALAALDAEVK